MRFRATVLADCCFSTLSLCAALFAQPTQNIDGNYQQLRNIGLQTGGISVEKVTLKRDKATFQFNSGVVCFVTPVNNKVTGAVFVGDGKLLLDPTVASELASLSLLTKEKDYNETFDHLVLRFTDGTYDELKSAGKPGAASCDPALLRKSAHAMRKELIYIFDARILQDVVSGDPGGLFVAFVHGKRYDGKTLFTIDPHGAPGVYPEEISLETYNESKLGIWAAFHYASEYAAGSATSAQANSVIRVDHQELDTGIDKSGNIDGKAVITVVSRTHGLQVVPFSLFRTLRVTSVIGPTGKPLNFIQEDKTEDPQFWVVLDKPLSKNERCVITVKYGGKDAVSAEGGGNYYPIARSDWYPNSISGDFGEYTTYDMTFHIPKGMTMAATGTRVSESNDGSHNVTVWKSEIPITVAGFTFGLFKREDGKVVKPPMDVASFTNINAPDSADSSNPALTRTTHRTKAALVEAQYAIAVFSDYFGTLPFNHLSITQRTAKNYGQSWPTLVYMPRSYYLDDSFYDVTSYFTTVASHEVAHQWWGHDVGFNSYRDQWMSEGFAELSASLYIQSAYGSEPQKYDQFWNEEHKLLIERNKEGYRAIDAGPVTMGYRLSNSREGFDITRHLIYPKGAYILHMIRMMMYDRQAGDQRFKETMHDFVSTYAGQSATTENFKAVVEKHMTAGMDLDGNHKMDWFFNEYIYGTQLPSYKLDYSFEPGADGDLVLNMKLAQSGVSPDFRMPVPIYLELASGKIARLGFARAIGNTTVEQKVVLKGVKEKPKRAMINHYHDVLATSN